MFYFKKIRLLHIKIVEILLPLVSQIKLSADEVQRISQKNKKKWLAAYPNGRQSLHLRKEQQNISGSFSRG